MRQVTTSKSKSQSLTIAYITSALAFVSFGGVEIGSVCRVVGGYQSYTDDGVFLGLFQQQHEAVRTYEPFQGQTLDDTPVTVELPAKIIAASRDSGHSWQYRTVNKP